MKNRKLSLVSLAVSSVLTGSVCAGTSFDNFDINANNGAQALIAPKAIQLNKNQLVDQFDKHLSTHTFVWSDEFKKPSSSVLNKSESHIKAKSREYLLNATSKQGMSKIFAESAELISLHQLKQGPIVSRYQQTHNGLEVFGRQISVLMNKNQQLVATSGYFAKSSLANQQAKLRLVFSLNEVEALTKGAKLLGLVAEPSSFSFKSRSGKYLHFGANEQAKNEDLILSHTTRLKPVYFPKHDALEPAYYIEYTGSKVGTKDFFGYGLVVSATDGKLLFRKNLIENDNFNYRTYADPTSLIPLDGPFGNELTPHPTGNATDDVTETAVSASIISLEHGPISTQDPWLSDNATVTSGNNVNAYADIAEPDGFGEGDTQPATTADHTFDYVTSLGEDSLSANGQSAAVVNLFYMNNFLHDWFYDNGFDEKAGNAQVNNYGRGGVDGDPLLAEAQDYSGTNNANMLTPADGGNPRMQMYLFVQGAGVGVSVSGVGDFNAGTAAFGAQSFEVQGTLVRLEDDTDPVNDGCESVVNAAELNGNIAVIDRGTCNFTTKVKAAQDAGAIGALIVNNAPNTDPDRGGIINMGGDDSTITIGSLFVSLEDGAQIYAAMDTGSVEATLARQVEYRDGTLDNAIVAHEWAHYLSNRLVSNGAGLVNNQGRSMGEGWSDFVALLMMVKESDALLPGNDQYQKPYAAAGFATGDHYFGIRRVPYSTDLEKNALMFRHIASGVALPDTHPIRYGQDGSFNSQVHSSGEVWANSLWEAYAALLNRPELTFSEAQDRMKTYLVAGLKMTPYAPTFTEARDGVLAAAAATDMEDFNVMLAAFAKRGLGLDAVAPDRWSTDHVGATDGYSTSLSAFSVSSYDINTNVINTEYKYCDNDGVWDATETALLTVNIKNVGSTALNGITATVSTDADVSFPEGATLTFNNTGGFGSEVQAVLPVVLTSAVQEQNVNFNISFPEIGETPEEVIEPSDLTFALTTNYDLDKARTFDDIENSLSVPYDWTVEITDSNMQPFGMDGAAYNSYFGRGQMLYGADNDVGGSSSLITPEVIVNETGDFSFSFFHYHQFESSADQNGDLQNWDAGVIEVSVNGGAWIDVLSISGATLNPSYSGTVNTFNTEIGGREAFVDANWPGDSVTVTIPEGEVNGDTLQFRFRIGTDANTGEFGWLIDDVQFNNVSNLPFSANVAEDGICVNAMPYVSELEDLYVSEKDGNAQRIISMSVESFDHEGDDLTFNWEQTAGTTASITGNGSNSISFTIPYLTDSEQMDFTLTVSDGINNVVRQVSVFVEEVNDAPTVSIDGPSDIKEKKTGTLTATGVDLDDTSLNYTWQQISGPTASVTGASSNQLTFTAPSGGGTLVFEVTVSDGEATATAEHTVNVKKDSGFLGSIHWGVMLVLGLVGLGRRKRS